MADSKIKDLTSKTSVVASDEIVINDVAGGNLDKKEAMSDIKTYMSNSPTLVTPALGTPSSGVLTSCTGLPLAGLVATTASRAMVTDGSGKPSASAVTATELGHVSGVTSAIQTQIDSKAAIASPTFTGTVTTPNLEISGGVKLGEFFKVFEDYCMGEVHGAWNNTTITDGGITIVVEDGIDKGYIIQTTGGADDEGQINFNSIRNIDPSNSTVYGIIQLDQDANVSVSCGVGDTKVTPSFSNHNYIIFIQNTLSFIQLRCASGSTSTNTNTDVAPSADNIQFKIVATSTNIKLYLMVNDIWTLKATNSTNLPTNACEPQFTLHSITNATAKTSRLVRYRAENTVLA